MSRLCYRSRSDTIPRIIAIIIISFSVLTLIFTLGFNNSSQSSNLPSILNNCSAVTSFRSIDPYNLKKSTNIFCSIMMVAIILGIGYQVFIIAGKFLKLEFVIEYNKYWACMDIFINSLFMYIMFMTVAGSFMLAFLRSQYTGLFNDQLSNAASFYVTTGFLWATFGFSSSGIYQTYNISLAMSRKLGERSAQTEPNDNPLLPKMT